MPVLINLFGSYIDAIQGAVAKRNSPLKYAYVRVTFRILWKVQEWAGLDRTLDPHQTGHLAC